MSLLAHIRQFARRIAADRGGNVLIITAAAIFVLAFAIGFGIDYARAQRLQTKLNAVADAAVLAAVDPSMLTQSSTTAQTAALAMFDNQVAGIPGLTVSSRSVTITETSSGSFGTVRKIVLTYRATSANSFSGVLKVAALPITGTATASASQPPSMNFYIALDTSPSMLLPTTSTGIANLNAGAIWRGELYQYGRIDGCDFACHTNNMQQWNSGVYVVDASSRAIYLNNTTSTGNQWFFRMDCSGNVYDAAGTQLGTNGKIATAASGSGSTATYCSGSNPVVNPVYLYYLPSGKSNTQANYVSVSVNFPDTWWLAQNYSTVNPGASDITLRTDAESDAAAGVIQYAYTVEQTYANANVPPVYKMQFFTFDVGNPVALSTSPFGTMTDVASTRSATFPNLGAQAPLMCKNSYWTSCSTSTGNQDTYFTSMFTYMKSIMPSSAGLGTPASPNSVLLIITDGALEDTTAARSTLSATNITQCNAIKATGARIAILYTQYLPETVNYTLNPLFNTFATGAVPNIQSKLQACASRNTDGTYLMQTVSTDGSVSAALNTLFAMTVQTARLVN